MDKERLQKYISLAVHTGIRVQKGEEIWIYAQPDNLDFLTELVEECYKAGAKKVRMIWRYDPIDKLAYKYMSLSNLGKVPSYELASYKYRAKKLPVRLFIESDDPDAMKGVNDKKVSKARMKSFPKIKPYLDMTDGKEKWCIIGVPSVKWAKKVFPKLNDEEAVEALWEAILKTVRVDENDPNENWAKHNAFMHDRCDRMNKFNFQYLKYKASNGTDFKVELNPDGIWEAAEEKTDKGLMYNPNMPTEEVFTSPIAGKCEGTLVASLPLSYNGNLIEDFSITFKDGKAVSVKARKNQKILEQMIKMDPTACMLGEVALVPFTSPVNQCGILFYSTLYDENAVCHFALGCGFKECLKGGADMTVEEAQKHGVNDSMIHVDFMVGTKDLSIIGVTKKGKEVQVFKDGVWAF